MQIHFTPFSLSWSSLVEKLQQAENLIVLVLSAIHDEWVQAIYDYNPERKISVKICIENSEAVIRKGYGNIEALKVLKKNGADIRQVDKLRIGFLSIDNFAGFLFLESRIIAGDPEGLNFVNCNSDQAKAVIAYFFPELQPDEPKPDEAIPDETEMEKPKPFDEEQFARVAAAIEKNPPVQPELERKINTYRTLFQYAELHYEGGRLSSKTISLPKNALPFKDAVLKERLNTTLKIFDEKEVKSWDELMAIQTKVQEIREKFLIPCSLRKDRSILKKSEKEAFTKAIAELEVLAGKNMNVLQDRIQTALNNSESTLQKELISFFASNPPESVIGLTDPDNIKRQIDREIQNILSKVNIPSAISLIKKVTIGAQYAELTYEDLHDDKFQKWFYDKKLIQKAEKDALASFEPAFELKKDK